MNSGGLREGFSAGLFPVERRQLLQPVLIGHLGQPLQQVFEVGTGFDPVHPAVGDQGVNDRVAPAGVCRAEEQPVFLANRRGANGVFHQVVVNLHFPVFQKAFQGRPLIQGIADGLAHRAFGQVTRAELVQCPTQSRHHHPAVRSTQRLSGSRSSPALPALFFPPV
jgi:hypothetical protein